MNKRLSILTLCIVGLSMLFILIGTLFNNTNDNIVDIIGDKNSLENINILYQNKDGIFDTRETIISKDGLNIKQFSKELPDIYKYSKEAIDNRDLFKHMYDTATIYHDENEIGCFLENGYGTDDKGNMDIDFIIKNKNLKTNKIKIINKNVNIKLNNSKVSPYLLPSVITKYNGTVYMLLSHIEEINNYVDVEDLRVIDNKVCLLLNSYKYANIYKDIEERDIAKHVLILDENSQDILYMGKYSDGDINYDVRYILKDDEL